MIYKTLFDVFSEGGRLGLPGGGVDFSDLPWSQHPTFEGVELKHLVTSAHTGGQFSYHLVRIAPNKAIGDHVHPRQLETHEVIAGSGFCLNNGLRLEYQPGIISIFPIDKPHEVQAGPDGLMLFAKFMPALI